jgi:uncharacterized repeat protein (TIGR02543 family)
MSAPKTATAGWKTQYYLTVNSDNGTTGGENWYDSGDTAYATVTPLTVDVSTGVQYVFTGWSGDATGTTSPSDPITMSAPKTATAGWKTQYYLTVNNSGHGTAGGAGWYDADTNAQATITPLTVEGTAGTRYVFNGWTGDASGSGSPSNNILMNGLKTATATWKTQYYLTFKQTGLDATAAGTVENLNGLLLTRDNLPYSIWVDNGTVENYRYYDNISSTTGGKRFRLVNVTGKVSPMTVTGPENVTGNYVVQYYLTFKQTGLDATAAGTVENLNGLLLTRDNLPYSIWVDNGTVENYRYYDNISSTTGGKRFRLVNVTGKVSPMTVTGPENVTGNYVVQYPVTFKQAGSPVAPPSTHTIDTYPTVDSWVELTNPNTNHGSDQTLHVRVNWDSGKGIVTNLRRTYLKFDLSSLPSGTEIDSAILHLFRSGADNVPSAYSTTDDWTEDGITWNNQPGPGALEDSSGTVSGSWIEWDITSYAGSEFEGDKVLSVVLKFDPESELYQHADFTSREGTLNQRPWLEISYKHKVTPNIGLDGTATGTVVTVNGATKTYADLPFSIWIDNGASVTYSYSSIVSSTISGKRFGLVSVTGKPSSITVTGPENVTGNYKTQYYLTVKTDPDGIATIPGEGWYDSGTDVTLTAPLEPKIPYLFAYWKVNEEEFPLFNNVIDVHMDGPKTATAVYKDYLGHAKEEIEGLREYITNLYNAGNIGKSEYKHFMYDLDKVKPDIDKAVKNLDTQRAGYDDKINGFEYLRQAVMKLKHIINDVRDWAKKGKIPATDATWIINELETIRMKLVNKARAEALVEKALALKAIADAQVRGKDTTKAWGGIAKVDQELAKAEEEIAAGELAQAIQYFKHAFAYSHYAIKKAQDPAWDIDYNDWIDTLEVMNP